MRLIRTAALFALSIGAALGQSTTEARPEPPPVSPEVHADGSVTFRFRAPNAKEVILSRQGKRQPMQKDERGVWTATTDPLQPDYYGYAFVADGVAYLDPVNPAIQPNLLGNESVAHVPGPPSIAWDVHDVPHGTLHQHFYASGVVGDNRDYYVYTPPDYDPNGQKLYPVLYLLHGFSDEASGWSAVGHANIILDNLIAQGKTRPMLVVMPLGYGAPEIVTRQGSGRRDPSLTKRNYTRFGEALLTEVLPQVEKSYRVSKKRTDRAIAGLSMGGAESLMVGLNSIDRFAWIGSFSAGGSGGNYEATYPNLDSKANSELRLLWIACGTEDRLIEPNRKFREWLKSKDIQFTPIETPGAHQWMVWRRNLIEFSQLLFR